MSEKKPTFEGSPLGWLKKFSEFIGRIIFPSNEK